MSKFEIDFFLEMLACDLWLVAWQQVAALVGRYVIEITLLRLICVSDQRWNQ